VIINREERGGGGGGGGGGQEALVLFLNFNKTNYENHFYNKILNLLFHSTLFIKIC